MPPSDVSILISAFMLGLLGAGHCLGMCGGIASALGLNTGSSQRFERVLAYNLGRIGSYCAAGAIVGSLGFWLSQQLGAAAFLRYLAAAMLILMGLYLGQWFNGLLVTEKLGHALWRYLQPLAKRFLPIRNLRDAFFVGAVWGWLPCGLVYSALIWSSSQPNILSSTLVMLSFGLGTLPAMLATGLFANRLSEIVRKQWFRSGAGLLMIIFGIWSLPIVQHLALELV